MNRICVSNFIAALSCAGVLMGLVPSMLAQPAAGAAVNPRKAALSKWHANQVVSFPTGALPSAVAFDGDHIWVANQVDNTVMKIRALDGKLLAAFPAGESPVALAFDGASVWVVNKEPRTVTRLRASDGKMHGAYQVGKDPGAIVYDGANIWVANGRDRTVTKLRASDGAYLGAFRVGGEPTSLAFDGTNLWVARGGGVDRLRPVDGTVLGTVPTPYTSVAVVFDGNSLWVSQRLYGVISRVRPSDGAILAEYMPGQDSTKPNPQSPYAVALAFDGELIWAAMQPGPFSDEPGFIRAIRASDGHVAGAYSVAEVPSGLAFDGVHIWVADQSSDRVHRL